MGDKNIEYSKQADYDELARAYARGTLSRDEYRARRTEVALRRYEKTALLSHHAPRRLAIFGDRRVGAEILLHERPSVGAIFGDVTVDLRDAPQGGEYTLDVQVAFGDVKVIVPPGMRVIDEIHSFLASVSVKDAAGAHGDGPILRLVGGAALSDVKVRVR